MNVGDTVLLRNSWGNHFTEGIILSKHFSKEMNMWYYECKFRYPNNRGKIENQQRTFRGTDVTSIIKYKLSLL